MTIRAFIVGLIAVIAVSLIDPYTSYVRGYGWMTQSNFPLAAVFIGVLLVLANVVIKLIRRRWALKQTEIMLVWCMVTIVSAVVCDGVSRMWYQTLVGSAYYARNTDVYWEEDGALTHAPEELIVTKDINSEVARQYFEGMGEEGRVPWRFWIKPMARWAAFIFMLFLGVFFLSGIMRRQWVDRERLLFPLARIPLEFTEGAGGDRMLPSIFYRRGFQYGLLITFGFRFARAIPLFFGAEGPWGLRLPLRDIVQNTGLEAANLENVDVWWWIIGLAFLVPADVSLSVWLFLRVGTFRVSGRLLAGRARPQWFLSFSHALAATRLLSGVHNRLAVHGPASLDGRGPEGAWA